MNVFDRILQLLFDVEPAGPGQEISWHMTMPQAWPSWFVLIFLTLAGAYFLSIYRREGTLASPRYKLGLAVLRWILVVLLLLMLGQLNLRVDRRGLPYLAILIDNSQSMGITDRYRDSETQSAIASLSGSFELRDGTRLDLAKAVLLTQQQALLRNLAQNHRLVLYAVSSTHLQVGKSETEHDLEEAMGQVLDLRAEGPDSRLGTCLRAVLGDLSGMAPAAVVYLTDGITTDGDSLADAAAYAARKNVPLYAIGIGDPLPVRDLELRDLLVDDVVFVDDVVNFEVKLTARGIHEGQAVVRLRASGQETPLATRKVDLPKDHRPATVGLQHRPRQVGEVTYVVEVEPIEREFQKDNNSVQRQVSVREHKLRALLVESYPRFEYRFLKHLLERDRTIDLRVLLFEADLQHPEQDRVAISHFPTSRDELRTYDVVLFGDVNPFYLNQNQLENLADFVVEYGGGLALLAGPRYMPAAYRETPLESVIPVDLATSGMGVSTSEPFQPVLTAEGRDHPILRLGKDEAESQEIFRNLAGMYWFFEAPRSKPGAVRLAVHPTRVGDDGQLPIILLQQVGAGKSLMLTTDSTWRWRDQVGDLYFSRFWVQGIRYLSRTRLLGQTRQAKLTADRSEYERGQPIELRVRLLDESLAGDEDDVVTVMVERDGGFGRQVSLNRTSSTGRMYTGVFSDAPEGNYRAWMVTPPVKGQTPAVTFRVAVPPGEFRKIELNEAGLKEACRRTGGKFFNLASVHRLAGEIPPGRKIPLDTHPPILLWNTWLMLLLFMGVLLAEWLLRKRKRML